MKIIFTLLFWCITIFPIAAQSVSQLTKSYSGNVSWNKNTSTLKFESTGQIFFEDKTGNGSNPQKDQKNNFWEIPKQVKHIIIEENVTVTGAFHSFNNIIIEGKNRKSSIVFGTHSQKWTDENNPGKQDLQEWYYSQFQNFNGIMTIKNLTILNPFSYFVRGFGPVVHVKDCDFIDNRGGLHNHSDGFCGGNGSTVDNCYFECGDDVFKVYFSYTVSNCTVNMIDNSVPIQLGWGNYSNGATCNFKNLKIIGNSGRINSDNAVISGRKGTFSLTINIDSCEIINPNAVFVSLWESGMTLNGNITNALINVDNYTKRRDKGICNLIICDSKNRKSYYNCQNQP